MKTPRQKKKLQYQLQRALRLQMNLTKIGNNILKLYFLRTKQTIMAILIKKVLILMIMN